MRWVLRPLSTLALDHLAAHGEPISASPAVVGVGAAIVLLACRRTIRKMRNIEGFWELVLGSNPALPANQSPRALSLPMPFEKGPLSAGLTDVELGRRNWPGAKE